MKAVGYRLSVMASLFVVACLSSSAVAGYDVSDLGGTWSIHGVVSGADPNVAGCFYMTGTADSAGLATASDYVDSQGVGEATWADNSVNFGLSGGGVVSIDVNDVAFHGVMNWDEDLVVNVGTLVPGPDNGLMGQNLWMWVKQASSPVFSIGDGAGTWWMHGLTSGDAWGGWVRAQLEITAAGAVSFVPGTFLTSGGDTDAPPDGSMSITGYGVVGLSYDALAHGIMNLGKHLIVFTMPESDGGGLSVVQKRSGVAFSTTDLAGTWHLHGLTAGSEWTGWTYGILEVDDAGALAGTITEIDDESEVIGGTLSITADGTVTLTEDATFHGTMSDDKDLIVVTMSGEEGDDEHELVILTRAVVSPAYRFWSPTFLHHFYTVSAMEKNYVMAAFSADWTYESEGYYASSQDSVAGLAPVYRFWSPTYAAHFYTISETERDDVIAQFPDDWTYEGPVFYAYPDGSQPADASPVYRFWSDPYHAHFYTISETEKDNVIATWPDEWTYECIAWYAYD